MTPCSQKLKTYKPHYNYYFDGNAFFTVRYLFFNDLIF